MPRPMHLEPLAFLTRQPPAWVADYIGLPFQELGRDRSGLDCWGLLRLVLDEQYGIDLPSYVTDYQGTVSKADQAQIAQLIQRATSPEEARHHGWEEVHVRSARIGAAIKLRVDGKPIHVGVLVAADTMLHIMEGIDSAIERIDGPRWAPRIMGFYRRFDLDA